MIQSDIHYLIESVTCKFLEETDGNPNFDWDEDFNQENYSFTISNIFIKAIPDSKHNAFPLKILDIYENTDRPKYTKRPKANP